MVETEAVVLHPILDSIVIILPLHTPRRRRGYYSLRLEKQALKRRISYWGDKSDGFEECIRCGSREIVMVNATKPEAYGWDGAYRWTEYYQCPICNVRYDFHTGS